MNSPIYQTTDRLVDFCDLIKVNDQLVNESIQHFVYLVLSK